METLPNKVNPEEVSGVIAKYREFLKSSGYSTPTVKNYLSDLRHLIVWVSERYQGFEFVYLNLASLRAYRSFVKEKFRAKPSIAARRLSSLRKFLSWANGQSLVPDDLVEASEYILTPDEKPPAAPLPTLPAVVSLTSEQPSESSKTIPEVPKEFHKRIIHHAKYSRPKWYKTYHKHPAHRVLHFSMLGVFLLLFANVLFGGLINELMQRNAPPDLGQVLAVTPPRILSFQGRLTDSSDVPVSSATNIVFRIYTSTSGDTGSPCAATCLWESKTWSVTPDQNGIFSVLLGDTGQADTAIPSTLFSDNAALYLGIKVGSDSEMTPRQRIASVSYALNTDTLDGLDSLAFLQNTTDSFDSGTLTIADGTTFTANSTSINLGNANSDTLTIASPTTHTVVNSANGSLNALTLSGTLGIFNGSDTFRGIYLNYTNANHTGSSNTVNLIDVANITGDAESSLNAINIGTLTPSANSTENAINIGSGWDRAINGAGALDFQAVSDSHFKDVCIGCRNCSADTARLWGCACSRR